MCGRSSVVAMRIINMQQPLDISSGLSADCVAVRQWTFVRPEAMLYCL